MIAKNLSDLTTSLMAFDLNRHAFQVLVMTIRDAQWLIPGKSGSPGSFVDAPRYGGRAKLELSDKE